ncbi:MAG: hypothetical protein RAK17_00910, partial [Caldisphaera sp.]|nr:hypothetical protein [Caldisphaera sp.]
LLTHTFLSNITYNLCRILYHVEEKPYYEADEQCEVEMGSMKLPMSSRGVSPIDGMGERNRGMRIRVDIKYHEAL